MPGRSGKSIPQKVWEQNKFELIFDDERDGPQIDDLMSHMGMILEILIILWIECVDKNNNITEVSENQEEDEEFE